MAQVSSDDSCAIIPLTMEFQLASASGCYSQTGRLEVRAFLKEDFFGLETEVLALQDKRRLHVV